MLRFIHLCILTIYMIFGLLDGKVKHKNLKFQNHSLERPARIVEPVFNEVRSNHNRPSRVVNHRSRDLTLINSTLVDSSKNGYGMLTGTPSPLAYDLDGGWVMAYRQWQGIDGGSGYLGLAKSVDGQNWYIEEKINDTYPEDQVDPNLPTANGQPGARYPSAIFSNNSDVRAAAVWNEYTTPAYGGGSYGGVPMYIYDQNPITNTTFNLSSMMHLNNGCLDLNTAQGEVCNPPDLWNGNVQLVNGFDGNSTLLAVYETWADGDIYGAKYMIRSTSFNNGYISLADPYFLHSDATDLNADGNCLWYACTGYTGDPDFHINDNGIGYMVLSSYTLNYEVETPFLHTFFFKKTTDYGATWSNDGGYQNSGYHYIPDSELIRLSDSLYTLWTNNPDLYPEKLWYNEVINFDGDGYDYYLTPGLFIGYDYDIKTDHNGGLHVVSTVMPYLCRDTNGGCSDADGNGLADDITIELRIGNSGMYHFYNPDPINTPNNWTASLVKDMSDTYIADFPTNGNLQLGSDAWFYFHPKISLSAESNDVVWFSTFAVSEFSYDFVPNDIDIYIAKSLDNGITWSEAVNVTNTNSSNGNYNAIETNVYLADRAKDNQVGLMFAMPDFNVETYPPAAGFEDYKNRVYFATYGDTVGAGNQNYSFVSTTGSDQNGDGTISNPYQTIQKAIDETVDGNNVFVNQGVYVENLNFNGKNIIVEGADIETTIINGGQNGSVVTFESGEDSTTILKNFTITNGSAFQGGGLKIINSNPTITDLYISENHTDSIGAGIYINNNSLSNEFICNISNVIVVENTSPNYPGMVLLNSKVSLSSSTIANNYATEDSPGVVKATVFSDANSQVNIFNSILWNESMQMETCCNGTAFNFNYSLVRQEIWPGSGNITNDPLFCGVEYSDYSIAENSPCIGSGQDGVNIGAFGIGCGPYIWDIVINEIMNNPGTVSDSDGEWFELYNAGDHTADITNWVFKDDGSDSLVLNSTNCCLFIEPGEYFLLVSNGDVNTNGGISDYDYVYNRDYFNLGNSDDEIIILNSYGLEIDRVEYDDGTTFPDLNGKSMELNYYNNDNSLGGNWVESDNLLPSGDYGTPGYGNSTLVSQIVTYIYDGCFGEQNNGSMDLGDIVINDSSECMLIVFNFGYGDLILSNIHIGEPQNDNSNTAFSVNVESLVIPPEETDSIVVYFHPEVAGFYSGSLVFETNDENNPTHNEAMHGTGLSTEREIYVYSEFVDSDTIFFYDVPLGESGNEYAYIINLGNTTLEIDEIVATEPFYIDITDGSLGTLETLDLPITFIPDSVGTFSGTVTIYSNDSDEEEYIIHLHGSTEMLSIDKIPIPDNFALHQNYPNPFNPVTSLRYDLPEDGLVNITVYDMMGRVVKTLVNSSQTAGYKSIRWNATNDRNEPVSAGLYLYTIQAGEFRQTKKMVLLK